MATLSKILSPSNETSFYKLESNSKFSSFVCSTPETRNICNNPLVFGIKYTANLQQACANILCDLKNSNQINLQEKETMVLHLLRGGLNFGLRESLGSAYNWNSHSSAFLSAQRAKKGDGLTDWYVTESSYKKVYFPKTCSLVLGDVVATGTSLQYALEQMIEIAKNQDCSIRSILFFTIGSYISENIISAIDNRCREIFPNYEGATILYLEGCFDVATTETKLSIKIPGTDLLRSNSVLAPEFIESQYENPAYPLERCTIYDAGSRAFHVEEYLEDVIDYWTETKNLAKEGMTFNQLLKERFPELDSVRFDSTAQLIEIANKQLDMLNSNKI